MIDNKAVRMTHFVALAFVLGAGAASTLMADAISIDINGTCEKGTCSPAPLPSGSNASTPIDVAVTLPDGDIYLIDGSFSGTNSGSGFSANHLFQVTYEGNGSDASSQADSIVVQADYAYMTTSASTTFSRDLLGGFGPTIAGSSSADSCVNATLACLGPAKPPRSFNLTTTFSLQSSGGVYVFDPAFTSNFGNGSAVGSYIVWGQTGPLPSTSPTPEPSSLVLMAAASLLLPGALLSLRLSNARPALTPMRGARAL